MLFSSSFVASIGLAVTAISGADAFWRMPCANPIVVERSDPIVTPGKLSGHVHTIMGPDSFDFTMPTTLNFEEIKKKTKCSTCQVTQDLSAYWTPNLWFQAKNGSVTPVPQNGGALIYYMQRQHISNPTEKLHAFPPGFRMLAGNPWFRTDKTSTIKNARAINYACISPHKSNPETFGFPKINCELGLRLQVFFPSCWDGKNIDSEDHKSHVAYPDDINYGICPKSHPKRLISLFYEVLFDINKFKDEWTPNGKDVPWVLSHGDATGFGLHGDFLNGWHQPTLQKAIDTCLDVNGDYKDCRAFDNLRVEDKVAGECFLTEAVNEKITGWLPALPGCNPITKGPADAVPIKDCSVQAAIGPRKILQSDMSALGWEYEGCVWDSIYERTFPMETKIWDNKMTIEMCIKHCKSKGFPMAGLEWANECFCGTKIRKDRLGAGRCTTPCIGNSKQMCGAEARMSVYKKKGYVAKRDHGPLARRTSEPTEPILGEPEMETLGH